MLLYRAYFPVGEGSHNNFQIETTALRRTLTPAPLANYLTYNDPDSPAILIILFYWIKSQVDGPIINFLLEIQVARTSINSNTNALTHYRYSTTQEQM